MTASTFAMRLIPVVATALHCVGLHAEPACYVKLDNGGPILTVPSEFLAAPYCGTAAEPARQLSLPFVISYPDMGRGQWEGVMDRYLKHDLGEGAPIDRFSAKIIWLFYANVPRAPKNTHDWHGPEPQVWQMLQAAKDVSQLEHPYPTPRITPSEIGDLRYLKFADDLRPTPEAAAKLRAKGWTPPPEGKGGLIEGENSAYELTAGCDGQFACQGHVQLKSSHIQYNFFIPLRARARMADFIVAMNKEISSWIVDK